MKNPLIKISNDILTPSPYAGHYRDDSGLPLHGIYIRQYKKTEEKLYIQNGNPMRKYRYPRIDSTFHSPMVNDYNLHLCGGWTWRGVSNNECITRVLDGSKPMGFFTTTREEDYNYWCAGGPDDKIFKFPNVGINDDDSSAHKRTFYNIGVCVPGTFGDNFNLETLAHDYESFTHAAGVPSYIGDQIESYLYQTLQHTEIADYLDSDYGNPDTVEDFVVTGLMLGYSVETTVSILFME